MRAGGTEKQATPGETLQAKGAKRTGADAVKETRPIGGAPGVRRRRPARLPTAGLSNPAPPLSRNDGEIPPSPKPSQTLGHRERRKRKAEKRQEGNGRCPVETEAGHRGEARAGQRRCGTGGPLTER